MPSPRPRPSPLATPPVAPEPAADDAGTAPAKRNFTFPSAFTVLIAVTVAVWALTFVLPAGRYDTKDGSPIPGTYRPVEVTTGFGERLKDLFPSPGRGTCRRRTGRLLTAAGHGKPGRGGSGVLPGRRVSSTGPG
ncbi:hypothetical protein [Streptomyces sp. NPDC004788]